MDQHAPLLRQQSERAVETMKGQSVLTMACVSGVLLAPAIACLVVATHYNASGTSCTQTYTVDLVTFLEVAGGVQIAYGGLALLCGIASVMMELPNGTAACGGCFGLFYWIWAGIGLYMWCNQMSDACQEDTIAKMVLAWSIIQFALIPAVCCIVCIMACCLGSAMAAVGIRQQAFSMMGDENADQAEPLNPQPSEAEPVASDPVASDNAPDEKVAV